MFADGIQEAGHLVLVNGPGIPVEMYRVAGLAGHNMKMQVRHELAGAPMIIFYDIKTLGTSPLEYGRHDLEERLGHPG